MMLYSFSTVNVVWRQLNFCARFASVKANSHTKQTVTGCFGLFRNRFQLFLKMSNAILSMNSRRTQSNMRQRIKNAHYPYRKHKTYHFLVLDLVLPCWVRSCVWNLASRAISRISRFMCGSMFSSSHTSDGIQRSDRNTTHKIILVRRTDYGNELTRTAQNYKLKKKKPMKVSSKLWLLKWPRALAHRN